MIDIFLLNPPPQKNWHDSENYIINLTFKRDLGNDKECLWVLAANTKCQSKKRDWKFVISSHEIYEKLMSYKKETNSNQQDLICMRTILFFLNGEFLLFNRNSLFLFSSLFIRFYYDEVKREELEKGNSQSTHFTKFKIDFSILWHSTHRFSFFYG